MYPDYTSAYAQQAKLFIPKIQELGYGIGFSPAVPYPKDRTDYDMECFPYIDRYRLSGFNKYQPDLVLTFHDTWILAASDFTGKNALCITPIDTTELGFMDKMFLRATGANPISLTHHGDKTLRKEGFDPYYIPHGIDLNLFTIGKRSEIRTMLGLPQSTFIAGIIADNNGVPSRKAFPEQFAAFAEFNRKHPDSLLLVHSDPSREGGVDLKGLAMNLGILDKIIFGQDISVPIENIVSWYQSLNVLMMATCGEGFGVPIIEAQACGIPVIGTDCSAITELIPSSSGWLVKGQKFWNPTHMNWWTIPNIQQIANALEKAYKNNLNPAIIRSNVLKYDADFITNQYWSPALEEMTWK